MRKLSLLLVLLVSLCTGAFAFAQEIPVFCGTLAEADCAILTSAQNPSIDVNSATFTINLNLNVTNIPEAPFNALAFSLAGDGSYAIDPAAVAAVESLDVTDPSAIDPAVMTQALGTMLSGLDAETTLTLTIPQEVAAMAAQGGGTQIPTTITLEAVLVDGIGYINFDQLAALAPAGQLPTGWQGINLSEIVTMMGPQIAMMAQQSAGGNPFASGIGAGMSGSMMDPAAMSEYASVARLADANVSGAAVAVFQTDINLGSLMNSQAFRDMMAAQSAGQPMPAEMDQMVAAMSNSTLTITEYVGTADGYTYQTDVNMNMSIDPAAIDASMAGTQPMNITFNMSVASGNLNAAPAIAAPAGATVIPTDALLGGMMGGSSMGATSGMESMPMATEQAAG